MDFNYLTKICFSFTVFWYWLPVPYATYCVTTKDGWDLVPAVVLQQWQGNAETKIPSLGGRKGWRDEQRCIIFCFAASWAQCARTQEVFSHIRQLKEGSLRPRRESGPWNLYKKSCTLIKHETSKRCLWLLGWERILQTFAVINIHLLCIQRGLHAAFSRDVSSVLRFESPPFCFTLAKPSLKDLLT